MAYRASQYRDPFLVVAGKEEAIARRIGSCKGCKHLLLDASTDRIYTQCDRDKTVGRKCPSYKETA